MFAQNATISAPLQNTQVMKTDKAMGMKVFHMVLVFLPKPHTTFNQRQLKKLNLCHQKMITTSRIVKHACIVRF